MMNEYIKPTTDIYAVSSNKFFAASPGVESGDGLGNGFDPGDGEFSKGGDWEDDDDLDGGSAMW